MPLWSLVTFRTVSGITWANTADNNLRRLRSTGPRTHPRALTAAEGFAPVRQPISQLPVKPAEARRRGGTRRRTRIHPFISPASEPTPLPPGPPACSSQPASRSARGGARRDRLSHAQTAEQREGVGKDVES